MVNGKLTIIHVSYIFYEHKKTIIHLKSIFYENKKLSFITCHLLLKIVSLHTIAYFYKI